jgi:hypothetical protein
MVTDIVGANGNASRPSSNITVAGGGGTPVFLHKPAGGANDIVVGGSQAGGTIAYPEQSGNVTQTLGITGVNDSFTGNTGATVSGAPNFTSPQRTNASAVLQ